MIFNIKHHATGDIIASVEVWDGCAEIDRNLFAIEKLRGSRHGVFAGADFAGADLRNAELQGQYLRDTNFKGCRMRWAYMRESDAQGANFENADCSRGDFVLADLRGANFKGANITGAGFTLANLDGADFTGAIWHDVVLHLPPLALDLPEYRTIVVGRSIQIGCQLHTIEAWENFTDDDILRMDGRGALRCWRDNKGRVLTLAKEYAQ